MVGPTVPSSLSRSISFRIRLSAGDSSHKNKGQHKVILANILLTALEDGGETSIAKKLAEKIQQKETTLRGALSQLSSSEKNRVRQIIGVQNLKSFVSLADEGDRKIFCSDLFRFGQRQEKHHNFTLAALVYSTLTGIPGDKKTADRAEHRLVVLGGGGTTGERIEFLGNQFIERATDPALLAGMGVAGAVFRGTSSLALRFLGRPSFANHITAWTTGFALEVPSFVFTVRGINELRGIPQDWSREAVRHELLATGLMLFALKSTGALGQRAVKGIRGQEAFSGRFLRFSETAIPQFSMFTGILGSHYAEVALGWKKPTPHGSALVDSLVTLLHFNVAGNLLNRIVPSRPIQITPKFSFPERIFSGIRLRFGPRPLFATGRGSQENIFLSQGRKSDPPKSSSGEMPPLRRVPKSSGIRPIENNMVYGTLRARLCQIEGEMYKIYTAEGEDTSWIPSALSFNRELIAETINIRAAIAEIDSESPVLHPLDDILTELTTFGRLLKQVDEITLPGAPKPIVMTEEQSGVLQRRFYRLPSRLINFIDGSATIEGALQIIRTAREILEVLVKHDSMVIGPLFESDVNTPFVREAHRISGELQAAFMLHTRIPWRPVTTQSSQGLSNLLNGIMSRPLPDHTPRQVIEDLQGIQLESQALHEVLNPSSQAKPLNGAHANPEHVLGNLYQVFLALGDFLREGDVRELKTVQHHLRQTRIHVEVISSEGGEAKSGTN